jgi:hypothetical protein
MNCDLVQRRLLSIEDPAQVPPDVRAHLAACSPCRDWQGQLVQLERHIPLLPVPHSRAKSRFLKKLIGMRSGKQKAEAATATVETTAAALPKAPWAGEAASHRLTRPRLLAGLAAAIALVMLGWWLLRTPPLPPKIELTGTTPKPDPLLSSLLHYDLSLATQTSPQKRIEALSDMAQALHDESRALALESAGSELKTLADLYEQVIREGIKKHASDVPAAERPRVLKPIADQLEKEAQTSDRLTKRIPPEYGKHLQAIATAAWEGRRYLTKLLTEGRS